MKTRPTSAEDIVVTGIGLVTPLGTGREASVAGWRSGVSAVGPIRAFDTSQFPWPAGAEVGDFDPRKLPDRKAIKLMSRSARLAVAAAGDALADAGTGAVTDGARCGLFGAAGYEVPEMGDVVGMMAGSRVEDPGLDAPAPGSGRVPLSLHRLFTSGRDQMNPIDALKVLPNMALAHVAITYGIKGVNASLGPFGASSLSCVAEAARAILRGSCDCALAGGTDSQVNPFLLSYLGTRGLLSPTGSCRPFADDRDGTVPGEGSAFFFLESRSRAEARGARAWARFAGAASHCDVRSDVMAWGDAETSLGYYLCGFRLLEETGWTAREVDTLAADGWGTVRGDAAEEGAIRELFSGVGPTRQATKGHLGHCGGGAGILDAGLVLTSSSKDLNRIFVWAMDPSGATTGLALEKEGGQ